MAEQVGRKLAGAMGKSPSTAGLTRIGPGMYRDKGGKVVGPQGQKLPQIGGGRPQQMAPMAQQAAPMPGMGGQGLGQMQPGQVENVGQEMGSAIGGGGMYTKPAIISGPGGGEPIRQFQPKPYFGQNGQDQMGQLIYRNRGPLDMNAIQSGFGQVNPGDQQQLQEILRYQGGGQPSANTMQAAMEAAPMPPQRQAMPSVGFIGGNFLGRRPTR